MLGIQLCVVAGYGLLKNEPSCSIPNQQLRSGGRHGKLDRDLVVTWIREELSGSCGGLIYAGENVAGLPRRIVDHVVVVTGQFPPTIHNCAYWERFIWIVTDPFGDVPDIGCVNASAYLNHGQLTERNAINYQGARVLNHEPFIGSHRKELIVPRVPAVAGHSGKPEKRIPSGGVRDPDAHDPIRKGGDEPRVAMIVISSLTSPGPLGIIPRDPLSGPSPKHGIADIVVAA